MKNKIYLSGKITGDNAYINKFKTFEGYISKPEFDILNPVQFKPFLGVQKWWAYMITCLIKLIKCEAIYFIPDWQESKGARIEYKVSKLLRKECFQVNPPPTPGEGEKVREFHGRWALYKRSRMTKLDEIKQLAVKYQKI